MISSFPAPSIPCNTTSSERSCAAQRTSSSSLIRSLSRATAPSSSSKSEVSAGSWSRRLKDASARKRGAMGMHAGLLHDEGPVCLQMLHRLRLLTAPLVNAGQVVVRVGVVGVEGDCAPIGLKRVGGTLQVLERHAEVEGGGGVVRVEVEGAAVVALGRGGIAGFVEEAAEVEVRVYVRGVVGE